MNNLSNIGFASPNVFYPEDENNGEINFFVHQGAMNVDSETTSPRVQHLPPPPLGTPRAEGMDLDLGLLGNHPDTPININISHPVVQNGGSVAETQSVGAILGSAGVFSPESGRVLPGSGPEPSQGAAFAHVPQRGWVGDHRGNEISGGNDGNFFGIYSEGFGNFSNFPTDAQADGRIFAGPSQSSTSRADGPTQNLKISTYGAPDGEGSGVSNDMVAEVGSRSDPRGDPREC